MGGDSSHETLKVTSVVYKRHLRAVTKNSDWRSALAAIQRKLQKFQRNNTIYSLIGKKNNQSSISDADQEVPALGSTDNAGNEVNLVSGIIR